MFVVYMPDKMVLPAKHACAKIAFEPWLNIYAFFLYVPIKMPLVLVALCAFAAMKSLGIPVLAIWI